LPDRGSARANRACGRRLGPRLDTKMSKARTSRPDAPGVFFSQRHESMPVNASRPLDRAAVEPEARATSGRCETACRVAARAGEPCRGVAVGRIGRRAVRAARVKTSREAPNALEHRASTFVRAMILVPT
jgi:hypothetical protein